LEREKEVVWSREIVDEGKEMWGGSRRVGHSISTLPRSKISRSRCCATPSRCAAETESLRDSRLRLYALTQRVMADGLAILGIKAAERM